MSKHEPSEAAIEFIRACRGNYSGANDWEWDVDSLVRSYDAALREARDEERDRLRPILIAHIKAGEAATASAQHVADVFKQRAARAEAEADHYKLELGHCGTCARRK